MSFSHGIFRAFFLTLKFKDVLIIWHFLTPPNTRTNAPFYFSVNTFFIQLLILQMSIANVKPSSGKKFKRDPISCQSLPSISRICIISTMVSSLMLRVFFCLFVLFVMGVFFFFFLFFQKLENIHYIISHCSFPNWFNSYHYRKMLPFMSSVLHSYGLSYSQWNQ